MEPAARRARDEWIALRCQSGEPAAFRDLVEEFERPLMYYVAKLLGDQNQALDVLQEVWLRSFGQIRRLAEPGSVRAWLYRMAHGIAIDRLRQDRSRRRTEQAKAEWLDEAVEPPDFGPHDVAAVHRALDELELAHRHTEGIEAARATGVGTRRAVAQPGVNVALLTPPPPVSPSLCCSIRPRHARQGSCGGGAVGIWRCLTTTTTDLKPGKVAHVTTLHPSAVTESRNGYGRSSR